MKYADMAITVSDLNKYMKEKIAEDEYLNNILIKGEISNFKNHYTGHMYFTLKDEKSLIKCIMFKSYATKLTFMPKDGMKVMILGSVSVFERDGVYQIYARAMEEDGLGDLYTKYQELKKRLEQQGLFEEEHKMKIPMMPRVIGVLTSQTGSVIRDIINVSTRRNPNVYIRLLPVPVQGEGAAEKISNGIEYMNKNKLADVLILARGGGSLEDLWPFNEEIVAHSIYNSEIPIISAVGHETDTTLTDYAADMRAPTPSAAAELAVYSYRDLTMELRESARQLQQSIYHLIKLKKILLTRYEMALSHSSPQDQIRQRRLYLADSEERLKRLLEQKLTSAKHQMALYAEELKGLSPLYKLQGGYAYVADDAGNNIKSIDQLKKGQRLTLTLKDGQADVVVQDVASKR